MLRSAPISNRIRQVFGLAIAAAITAQLGAGCGDSGDTARVSCSDGIKNGKESDIDCGGGVCKPCTDGQSCTGGSSCTSGVCLNEKCLAASCTDGIQNGDETSIDCGGKCIQPETCNGKDDDCNGKIDDGIASIICGLGVCQVSVAGCTSGQPSTCSPGAPMVEVCDGLLDEDCDGKVDNGCSCKNGDTQSCYSGSMQTMGVGSCHAGKQTCIDGAWGNCDGEVTPELESCNGVDDDCNGSTDDGLPSIQCGIGACAVTLSSCENGQPTTCSPGQPTAESCNGIDDDCNGTIDDGLPSIQCGVGACAVTVPGCANGMPGICVPGQPSAEACNGIDDDCNGTVDDGNPGGGISCDSGLLGVCAIGTTTCSSGKITCPANAQPSAETCDGMLDEDCNGVVDNGCACTTGTMQSCYEGPAGTAGVGACVMGTQICSGGVWSACTGQTLPKAESCNAVDDNCNGMTDENNPGGGQSCSTGNLGICAAGTTNCSSGTIICVQNNQAAPTEDCNTSVDDNCNGQINENCGICTPFATRSCYSGPAGTAGVGICKNGTETCNAAGSAWGPCTGEVTPTTESCKNNLDDNCNGQTNEGCSALSCQNFYVEDFNDGTANSITGVYDVGWCNSYVATAANTPACLAPGQTTRTNATGGTNAFVGIWVNKDTASCSAVRLSYDWYQFANAGAVVEYKQTTDTFSSYSSCSTSTGWTTAVPSTSMSALGTCNSIVNINIPFGTSPAVYIKFKSTNSANNAMWWDNIKLTLVGCDC